MTQNITSDINTENNIKSSYFSTMMSNNTSSISDVKNQDFFKLIDNVNAKTMQIQTNIASNTAKSNTSSINKKALNDTTSSTKDTKTQNPTNVINSNFKKSIQQSKQPVNQPTQKTTKSNVAENTVQNTKQQPIAKNTNATTKNDTNNQINTTKDNTSQDKLSDINNSSPVSTSPVVSFDEQTNTNETTQTNEKDDLSFDEGIEFFAVNATVLPNVDIDIKDTFSQEDLENNIDNLSIDENTLNVIEKVSEVIDNSDLSQSDKKDLNSMLANVKNNIQKLQTNNSFNTEESDFSTIVDNAKENTLTNDIKTELKETLNKVISTIQNPKENTEDITLNINQTTTEEIKPLIQDIKNLTKENTDTTNSTTFQDTKTEVNTDNENTIDNSKETISNTKDLVENLKDIKKSLQNQLTNDTKETKDENIVSSTVDTTKENISLDQKPQKETLTIENKTTSNEDTKNTQNTDLVNEIANIIKSASSKTEKVTNNNETDKISFNTPNQSQDIENTETIDSADQTENETQQLNSKTEAASVKKSFNENNSSNSENFDKNFEKDFSQKTASNTKTYDEENSSTDEININNNTKTTTNNETEKTSSSFQQRDLKEVFSNKSFDMVEDISFNESLSEAGALSVSDEVAKIALNTKTSDNLGNTILTQNDNSMIKNISFAKTLQQQNQNIQSKMETNDVMGQITDKLQNLKNSQGQKLTMILRPNDLGRLSIELTTNEKGLTTNILAQNSDVRNYIEKNIDSLRQQLSNAGINVNTIQIKTAGEENATFYNGNQNSQNSQENQNQQQNHENPNKKNEQNQFMNANYDSYFAKTNLGDFSSVLTNTFNYSLN